MGLDLAAVVDLFAQGILASSTTTTAKAADIGTLAEDIVKLGKTESVLIGSTNAYVSGTTSQPLGVYIAATLADYLKGLGVTGTAATAYYTDISNDVKTATNATIGAQVKATLGLTGSAETYTEYPDQGAISVQESPVTNL